MKFQPSSEDGNAALGGDARPSAGSSIVTLSTCTANGHSTRWVVQAFRVG